MKIIVSAAVSLDGYLDDCAPERLKLSSPEDWRQVEELRAQCDAILVGAETVRRDNPSLVIRDEQLRRQRRARGQAEDIVKVTVTVSEELDPSSDFFTQGADRKIVFASRRADGEKSERLREHAEIIRAEEITPAFIIGQLSERGCSTLLVEGGSRILTMFFESGAVDEFRLAVAPFFVGDANAPRLVRPCHFLWTKDNRMRLEGVEMLGDTAVMYYKTNRG